MRRADVPRNRGIELFGREERKSWRAERGPRGATLYRPAAPVDQEEIGNAQPSLLLSPFASGQRAAGFKVCLPAFHLFSRPTPKGWPSGQVEWSSSTGFSPWVLVAVRAKTHGLKPVLLDSWYNSATEVDPVHPIRLL